ncbi:DOPA 4,5-dioxygenase family protein [Chromobacterium vaccinii]|uniref:DOPA 4,5-dioxygenase family protein n=1 Tax=Chromobacterium vaccinii TaxID=1108595 RepID=UPI003C7722ED
MTRPDTKIEAFHAHVYFEAEQQPQARRLRELIPSRFDVNLGRWREVAYGPHPTGAYQVEFAGELFGELVPWLMLHRDGLDILVHPLTGDDVVDHTDYAMWLGTPLTLNIDFLRRNG